jgi:hypothetical protein
MGDLVGWLVLVWWSVWVLALTAPWEPNDGMNDESHDHDEQPKKED